MEHLPAESRDGLYQTYTTPSGVHYIVLEGLSPEKLPAQPYIQQRIHEHITFFLLLYWSIACLSLAYMAYTYLGKPLWHKYRAH